MFVCACVYVILCACVDPRYMFVCTCMHKFCTMRMYMLQSRSDKSTCNGGREEARGGGGGGIMS